MNIALEPHVVLVGRSQIDQAAVQQFLADQETTWITDTENGAELLSELAGRVCYMSFGKRQGRTSNRDYLANIVNMEHGSVLEHSVWNFVLTGVSRSLTHELVRHRVGVGFSQLSQRYVDESNAAFVPPEIVASDPELFELWKTAMSHALACYERLAEGLAARVEQRYPSASKRNRRIIAHQAARSVLPNSTESKVFFSANARALRHIIEYRGAADAEPEIRRLAVLLLEVMREEAPNTFADYEIFSLDDGSRAVSTQHKKV